MISKVMQDALNKQINAEIWSAYLYLSMSAYFDDNNLPGFANWMKIQWQEEISHAMKMFDYVSGRGGRVLLEPIAGVKTDWADSIEIFNETLEHERKVSGLINNLVNVAISEADHATNNFLQWFVAEQVEEESTAENLLVQLKMINGSGHGMLMLDRELSQRIFVDATKK